MLIVATVALALLAFLGVPIVFALGAASAFAIGADGHLPLMVIAQRMISQIDSFTLLAVPLFVFAGAVMEEGGISARLVRFADAAVGHRRGGLAIVAVLSCFIFSGISGSSAADASAVGALLIPAMKRNGYPAAFAAALVAGAATMGPIIPPSTLAIIYASLTDVPVAKLFLGCVLPGILLCVALVIVARLHSRQFVVVSRQRASGAERLAATHDALPALAIPVIILVGVVSGVVTATESGALAAVCSLVTARLIYRDFDLRKLQRTLISSTLITGLVLSVIAAAGTLSWILVYEDVPRKFADLVLETTRNPFVVLLLILTVMFIVGCVMEIVAAGIIMIPVIAPLATMAGADPLHVAVLMIMTMAVGAVTPPVGITLFVTLGIARTTLAEVNRYIWPIVFVVVAVILLCAAVPSLVTWLPGLFLPPR